MRYQHLSAAQLDRLAWRAGREVDPDAWAGNVRDAHRVLKVVQTLWVFLEQFNEPLLRVGVEIVTASDACQELLRWKEATWYVDENKRNYLQALIQDKLAYVLEAKILGIAAMGDMLLNTEGVEELDLPTGSRKQTSHRPEPVQLKGSDVSQPSQKPPTVESGSGETGGTGASDGSVPKAKFEASQAELLEKRRQLEGLQQEVSRLQERVEAADVAAAQERARADAAVAAASAAATEATTAKAAASKAMAEHEKAKEEVSKMAASTAALDKVARRPSHDRAQIRKQSKEAVEADQPQEVKVDAAVQADRVAKAEPILSQTVDGPCTRCEEVLERAQAREVELQKQLKQQALAVEEMSAKLKEMLAGAEAGGAGDQVRELIAKVGLSYVLKTGSVWDRLYKDAEKRIRRFRHMSHEDDDGKAATSQAEDAKISTISENEASTSQLPPRWTVSEDWLLQGRWTAQDRSPAPTQTVGAAGDLRRAEKGWAPGLAAHREEPWAGGRWKEPLREEVRPRWGQEELREAEEQLQSYLLDATGGEAACITGHRQPRHRRGNHSRSEEPSVQDQLQSSDLWQRLREQQEVQQQKQATTISAPPRRQGAGARTVGTSSQGMMPTLTESHSLPSLLRTRAEMTQQQEALGVAAAAAGFRTNFRPAGLRQTSRQRKTHGLLGPYPWR